MSSVSGLFLLYLHIQADLFEALCEDDGRNTGDLSLCDCSIWFITTYVLNGIS
jgi:hypothetical protein